MIKIILTIVFVLCSATVDAQLMSAESWSINGPVKTVVEEDNYELRTIQDSTVSKFPVKTRRTKDQANLFQKYLPTPARSFLIRI